MTGRQIWSGVCGGLLVMGLAVVTHAQDDPAKAIAARAAALATGDSFSGALLVAQNGKVLLRQGYGLADREGRVPVTPETRFRLGSMDKMFTAVAILQFVEAGKLSLDDAVGKALPGYPNPDVASRVTIRHLLTHSGGTGDIFPEYVERKSELASHDDFVRMFGRRGLAFEPGSAHRYSNYGFILLGAVIERLSGTSYYDHVAANVFGPAGMRSTDSPPGAPIGRDRAIGYVRTGAGWTANTNTLPARGTSAGGGYSTVDDLLRFAVALQDGTLLSKPMFAAATTPVRPGSPHGLGFMIAGAGASLAIGHSGGAPGMSGDLRILPGSGHVFVALANHGEPGIASILSREFRQAATAR